MKWVKEMFLWVIIPVQILLVIIFVLSLLILGLSVMSLV